MDEPLEELVKRARRQFLDRFGRPATIVAVAPGRVNLIGEHIDYNDGFVLPMAIQRYVVIAADQRQQAGTYQAAVYSANIDASVTLEAGTLDAYRAKAVDDPQVRSRSTPLSGAAAPSALRTPPAEWTRYLAGVLDGFGRLGVELPSFDAAVLSNVPLGGGLSSSAALEVAMATLLEELSQHRLDAVEKALLCQRAEHEFAGVPCGIMDQFSSVFGCQHEVMLLDCRSRVVRGVSFADDAVTVLITNSNVKHSLTGGEYAGRRRQCDSALQKLGGRSWRDISLARVLESRQSLTPLEYQRARHVVTETERTQAAATALEANDWSTMGRLMYESHDSLRDDFQVSCSELDVLVDEAQGIGKVGGVFGSRMTGGGFGGCTVSLVDTNRAAIIATTLATNYRATTGIAATWFVTRPARGAHAMAFDRADR